MHACLKRSWDDDVPSSSLPSEPEFEFDLKHSFFVVFSPPAISDFESCLLNPNVSPKRMPSLLYSSSSNSTQFSLPTVMATFPSDLVLKPASQ